MSGRWEDWEWDPTLFEGAAPYYDRGRLPYAPGLADAAASALGLDGSGRLLDVGCGPGTVALRLAHLFDDVVGLDPDSGMLAEAERLAAERRVTNARWVRARAEDLPAGLGKFRLVTFAASFHWMDRPKVASAVLSMLDAGGAVVHVDNRHHQGFAHAPGDPPPPPTETIVSVRTRYLGPDRRAGQSIRNTSPSGEEMVFRAAGFSGPEIVTVPEGRLVERTVDDLVAEELSSSGSAPHLFGDRLADYEADLRAALAAVSPSGLFSVRLPDNALMIYRDAARA
jgi:SAM-dependent methyltransferase